MLKAVTASLLAATPLVTSLCWAQDNPGEDVAKEGPVETVNLRYGWGPGVYARVEVSTVKEKWLGEESQGSSQFDMSYILSTKAHEQGLQVDFLDVKSSIESDSAELQGWMKGFMEAVSAAVPSYIVSADGELLGATKVPELRNVMLSQTESLLAELPEAEKESVMTGLAQVLSEEALNAALADEWNLLVGQWIGAEFDNDGVYQAEFEMPVPAFGNQLVKSFAEYEFVERVDCDDRDTAKSCALLLYRTQTDDVSMKEFMQTLIPEGVPLPDLQVSVRQELELVVDPATLLTYAAKTTKYASAPVETPEGMVNTTQVETAEHRFLYVMGNR